MSRIEEIVYAALKRRIARIRYEVDDAHATFEIDILACPQCGGRLRLVATITQAEVIEKILAHLGLPTDPVVPEPARSEAELFA